MTGSQSVDLQDKTLNNHAFHWTAAGAAACPVPEGIPSALIFSHGSMTLRYYAPTGRDEQLPHGKDEFYVIAVGGGLYEIGGGSDEAANPFTTGDALFAPAGVDHCFRDFSEDFGCWVVFYGDKGGEVPGDLRPGRWSWSAARAEEQTNSDADKSAYFTHGTATLNWYCPKDSVKKGVLPQDSLFFVNKGAAEYKTEAGLSAALNAGDVLFIAANTAFTLETSGNDFAGWLLSWGPDGGEA